MTDSNVTILKSKTKSGAACNVAVIPLELVDSGLERMHFDAVGLARANGCAHYRVMDGGRIVAAATVGPLPTQEQTALSHGDGSDWDRD
jgi:hypothetical protein